MALYTRILSRRSKLPTHWSYSDFDDTDAAPGFQVWIRAIDAVRTMAGRDEDGIYDKANGYTHLAVLDCDHDEARDGGPGAWLSFRRPRRARQLTIAQALTVARRVARAKTNEDLADINEDRVDDDALVRALWRAAKPFTPQYYDPRRPQRRRRRA